MLLSKFQILFLCSVPMSLGMALLTLGCLPTQRFSFHVLVESAAVQLIDHSRAGKIRLSWFVLLFQGLANFYCKGSDNKYFRLCEPYSLCHNDLNLPLYPVGNCRQQVNDQVCCFNKTAFQKTDAGLDLAHSLSTPVLQENVKIVHYINT